MADFSDPTKRGRGGVASVDALASSAGVAMLRAGGTAADAAVAASAVLAVTCQHLCGLGGDLLAIVHPGGAGDVPRALVSAGRAGSGADAAQMRAEGLRTVPLKGDIRAVTVPGCVDGWLALHGAHGRLPLAEVLAPAADAAEHGFPLSPLLAGALPVVAGVPGAAELVGTLPAAPGEVRRRPGVARSLQAIAGGGREAWYGGEFGAGLLRVGAGLFAPSDLQTDLAIWSDPLAVDLPAGRLHLAPAPSQAYLVGLALAIADRAGGLPDDPDDPAWAHHAVEAARAAGWDRPERLHDGADLAALLQDSSVAARASGVSHKRASGRPVPTQGGGTIFLCAVDADGMAVSLSQSNASGFGAHITVPELGVFLHDRGLGFSLVEGSPAELAPGRRPPHTLSPTLVTDASGAATVVAGTMGGDAQPQIVQQLLLRVFGGASAGRAVGAPRFALAGPDGSGFDTWLPDDDGLPQVPTVLVEAGAPWAPGLAVLGHAVEERPSGGAFGHAHLAVRGADGFWGLASDPRCGSGSAAVL